MRILLDLAVHVADVAGRRLGAGSGQGEQE